MRRSRRPASALRPASRAERTRAAAGAAPLVAVVSLLAACGSSGPHVAKLSPTVTGRSSSTTTSGSHPGNAPGSQLAEAIAFATCMRSHGEPDYPDPTVGAGGEPTEHLSASGNPNLDPSTPRFQAAQRTCLAKQPPGSAILRQSVASEQRQELKFAACMRAHGEPDFPDPTMLRYGIELQLPPNINPGSPAFLAAQRTCTKLGDGPASF
jgi:hypothetical protein